MPPTVPDLLTKPERVAMFEGQLQSLQREEFSADLQQVAVGAGDGERSPYVNPSSGEPETYKAHRDRIQEAQKQLVAKHGDLLEDVKENASARADAAEQAAQGG